MWKAIYETSTGILVSIGTVVAEPLPEGLSLAEVGESYPLGSWNKATLSFESVSSLPDSWSRYEFLSLLTGQERIAIRERAKTDPVVYDFMDLLSLSGTIFRSNPNVKSGLEYLASIGCLEVNRPMEILNG